jgi:hypothetical protein
MFTPVTPQLWGLEANEGRPDDDGIGVSQL